MPQGKKNQPKKTEISLQFLKRLEKEDPIHNDHGEVIIGRRDQKPIIPEEKELDKKS